jgi:hypothetical protein
MKEMKEMGSEKCVQKKSLLCSLKKALKGLGSQRERRAALSRLNNYVAHLEYVQQTPLLTRLSYWECAYAVFDFLRRNKQLGRTVGKLDAEVKQTLDSVIQELWYDDEH